MLTELVFIIDESGSMSGLEQDTIGGFNSTISRQLKEEGECLVSTVFFNTNTRVLHDRVKLGDVKKMGERDYCPSGCTALIDALGGSIRHISNVHRYIRKEDVPDRTLFVITTDGMENASRKYSAKDVKEMIAEKKKAGWDFIFLAANIDAVETAREYGISEDRAVNYINDKKGTTHRYNSVNCAISSMRAKGCVEADWMAEVKADYAERSEK